MLIKKEIKMNTNLNKLNVDSVRKSGQILCDLYNSDNQSVNQENAMV